jgi:valyl-tRNA synthetase
VRYWAANGRPGADTTFDPGQMKVGRRLATKILNASRFALLQTEPTGDVTAPLDKAMLLNLARLVTLATKKLEEYDYTSALSEIEKSFWNFCDDYIELVKARRYGDFGADSASSANGALLVRHGGSVVLVAYRQRAPRPVAGRRGSRADRRRGRRCPLLRRRADGKRRDPS